MERRYFIASLFSLVGLSILSAFEAERISEEAGLMGEKVSIDVIKRQFKSGNISEREAMYYEVEGEGNRI